MSALVPHVIEEAWGRFRNSPGGLLLQRSIALRSSYLGAIGLPRLPPEVVLPGAIPWNLLARAEARGRGKPVGPTLSREGTILAQSVAIWAAYRESKTLYAIDPLLAEALAHTPWPTQVPTAALRLPSRCPVLILPWETTTVSVAAYYDLLTAEEASRHLELRLGRLVRDRWETVSILHLTGEDLGACVHAAGARVEREGGPAGSFQSDLAGLALTVLLYLGGEPDLVRQVHPGAKPARESRMHRRDPERWRDLRAPTLYAVGTAFRAAIERWEIEQPDRAGPPTGRSVRPHVRRAHAHLYWTGPGRTAPRVRFLLPIPVKGGPVPEEAPQPTERPVR